MRVPALERKHDPVAWPHHMARLRDRLAIDGNGTGGNQGLSQRARLYHAGKEEPFVDTLKRTVVWLRPLPHDYFFICSLRAASLAKGESGSIGFSFRGGFASKRAGCDGLPR